MATVIGHLFSGLKAPKAEDILQITNNDKEKRWLEFNYPPGLKLIHYKPSEINEPFKGIVKKMNLQLIIVIVCMIVQFINCISQVASSCEEIHGRFLFYSFMNLFLWPALAFFVFYKGYYALCLGKNHESSLKVYFVAQVIMCLFYFIFIFIRSGPWNGFAKFPILSGCKLGFSIFLACIEILLDIIVIALGAFCLWKTKNTYDPNADVFSKETSLVEPGQELQNIPGNQI